MTNEEMVARFERRFDQLEQRIAEGADENRQRFTQIDGQFEQVDGRFEQVEARLDRVEDEAHQAHILIEGLDAKIDQVIDGVVNIDQKFDRFRKETSENFAELGERVTALETMRR